jgi:hypothetical protein
MENCAVVKTLSGVLEKVGRRHWRFVKVQFNVDITVIGFKNNHNSRYSLVLLDVRSRYNNGFITFEKADLPL